MSRIHVDRSYIHDDYQLNGRLFVNFIATLLYCHTCSHRPVIAFRMFDPLHAARLKRSFASLSRSSSPH
ncbi:MAG: hypothetical protein KIY11_01125 [Thermoplasmata archaeon]|nr:hypothetical protein [Candidatus Sysuiplasma acidicola]